MNTTALRFAAVFAIGALCGSAAMLSTDGHDNPGMLASALAASVTGSAWGETTVPAAAEALAALADDTQPAAPSF